MGVYIHLAVISDRISESQWDTIYETARRVARQWTPPPLSSAWRDIGSVRVAQYTPDFESELGLHIVGDATTLTTGESFRLPRRLGRPSATVLRAPPAGSEDDVLVAVALRNTDSAHHRRYSNLFGDKTQGFPYHTLILALGLVVERSLPGTAVVYGDIDVEDGDQARRGLSAILEQEVDLPVVLDEQRLRQRLSAVLSGDELETAVRDLGPSDPYAHAAAADLLGLLRSTPRARMEHELEHVVRTCRDPQLLTAETRLLLRNVLDSLESAMARHEIRPRVARWGAARTRELLALQTQSRMRFTSATWDAIETAGLDELAFVYTAVCVDSFEWHLVHALRGLIENPRLRRVTP